MAPATSANLGPGFDCLGLALDLWNQLDVLPGPPEAEGAPLVEVVGEGVSELPTSSENLVYRSISFLFHEAGLEMPPLRLRCHNRIPLKRGLGSSAAAIASGLVAANALCSSIFSANELLEMAATIEGHPDNVAAAVLGGLQLVVAEEEQGGHPLVEAQLIAPLPHQGRGKRISLFTAQISVSLELHAVLFIPELRIATADARAVLPEKVSRADAVYNMSRAALLVAGMATNHPEYFSVATQDRLHQPYRQSLFPAMKVIFAAGQDAGALGVFLSGSGSTILALTRGREMTVAYEMAEAARRAGVAGQVKITQPTTRGAHVMAELG
jgi:homoserine kinase